MLPRTGFFSFLIFIVIHQNIYFILNSAEFEPAPLGNHPSALTTKSYVLIKLLRNSYTLNYIYFPVMMAKRSVANVVQCQCPEFVREAKKGMSLLCRKKM